MMTEPESKVLHLREAVSGGLPCAEAKADVIAASSLDEAKVQLRQNGIALMEGVFGPAEIAEIRRAFAEVVEADREAGKRLSGFDIDRGDVNSRVVELAAKHPKFREMAEHPTARALVKEMLGERIQLTSFSANITAPGCGKMIMHCDQGYMPSPWPLFSLGVNIGIALDDFTLENGATLFVPGSHKELHAPDPDGTYPQARPVLCRAGAMFALDDRLWHQTGANVTVNEHRIGLFAHYTRSFLAPQERWADCMPPEVKATLSPSLRQLLAIGTHPSRLLDDIHRAV